MRPNVSSDDVPLLTDVSFSPSKPSGYNMRQKI